MTRHSRNYSLNAPLDRISNAPLELLVQSHNFSSRKRRYTTAQGIDALAVKRFKTNGKGITFEDLITSGMAPHKQQAQSTLKRFLTERVLFVIEHRKPQRYFPSSLKSEILKARLSKNAPIEVTEVPFSENTHLLNDDTIVGQTLQGYVLPMLSKVPIHIHKIQLRLKLRSEYYDEIPLRAGLGNKSKEHQEIVGCGVLVRYLFYPNGTVMVFVECSNNPFRLEGEEDVGRLIAFLGAVRDRLVVFLHDFHERVVPGVMQWYLTQCDINKDVKVSDWLQFTGLNIQVRHAFHLFRLYIKSKGEDTLCRVEESISLKNKSAIEAINDIFSPNERLEKQIADLGRKIDWLLCSNSISNIGSTPNKVADLISSNSIGRRCTN
jgi:hypothetical protein